MPDPLGSQAPMDGLSDNDLNMLRSRGTSHHAMSLADAADTRTALKNFG